MTQENQADVKQDKSEVPNVRIVQKGLENVSAGGNIHVQIIQNAGDRGDVRDKAFGESKPISNSVKQLRIKTLQNSIQNLQEDYQAVYNQLDCTQSEVERFLLKRQIKIIERELEEREQKLNALLD
jgi:hypothetical protein